MSPRIPITIIFFFIFSFCSSSLSLEHLVLQQSSSTTTNTDIHELLPQYGLPKGLLPDNVVSYSLSPDGSFNIQLQSPCYVHFDQLVYYHSQITGKLSYGSVSDVSGIQAKKLFLWLSVTGIKVDRDSGMLEFFVGALSEQLPAKQFEDVPGCSRKAFEGSATTSLLDHI